MRVVNHTKYDLPYDRIESGYYSAAYFSRGRAVLEANNVEEPVTMQVFQKKQAKIAGIDEAIAVLKVCSDRWEELTVHALPEGAWAEPWETVMTIRGPLRAFMQLESVYLGILRDATTVATNMSDLVAAANGKPVLYMADRFNGFENQARQGEAALLGGANAVVTPAGVSRVPGQEAVGTMPHALIAAFGGDVVQAAQAFHREFPDVNLIALVDFNNDCVRDALRCAEAFGDKLFAVRLDTSEKMMDASLRLQSIDNQMAWSNGEFNGVNKYLVRNVRDALDHNGYNHVKIAVSGGFNVPKISRFEHGNVPVDIYGVGSSVLQGGGDFTSDVVEPVAKQGRQLNPNPRLELVK